ncbi:putative membrane-anchored protein [Geomicrobium halophilum]|uniref:Putative membrane-anchored protein n=1 Tax=Geomicrobium halophilum TaxID=549000 RepID=A0A841PJI7_9BACL|nr:putative cytokinetic ring protein SteA [Geomicrobium halophilum]MBB6448940.1 putative membrane-anchored protein [Geomicrobium halophilum]
MRIGAITGTLHHLKHEWRASNKGKVIVANQEDLSENYLEQMLRRGVKAVVNGQTSMTGHFDHRGVQRLLEAGIPVFDVKSSNGLMNLHQGRKARITNHTLYMRDAYGVWKPAASLTGYDHERVERLKQRAASLRSNTFKDFYRNSTDEANKQLSTFLKLMTQAGATAIGNRPLLIVAPTSNVERVLLYTKRYFKRIKPFIIAVDTACRKVYRAGLKPDVILGDFTYVDEQDLTSDSLLVIPTTPEEKHHASVTKLQRLQLSYTTCSGFGGLEETAILYARSVSNGTIFMLGSGTNMEEAMGQGRSEIGVQALMHLWFGSEIVDVKGVSKFMDPSINPHKLDWLATRRTTSGADGWL